MLAREIRDFVRVTLDIQRSGPEFTAMDQAKLEAARLLGVDVPSEAEFNQALVGPEARRKRGRRHSEGLSNRDAVAAVAVYFESKGAGAEQAIIEAKRWLNLTLSRRVAKVAVSAFKANTSPDQFKPQALWAYSTFKPGTTQPLPESMTYARKKRGTKSDLG